MRLCSRRTPSGCERCGVRRCRGGHVRYSPTSAGYGTSSLIMGGTSTALVLLVGFLVLQEPLTGLRALAIALIATGIFLLQTQGG